MKHLFLMAALLLISCTETQQPRATWEPGSWAGTARAGQEQTGIRINIRKVSPEPSVDIDLLDIGVIGIPARDIVIKDNSLELAIPSDSGLQPVILQREGDTFLAGTWSEAGKADATLHLEETQLFTLPAEQRITSKGEAGILGASVIMPDGAPLAGAVFVHGSGPESRDASRYAAIRLAESGIASVFFDKRGVGESEGDWQEADFHALAREGRSPGGRLRPMDSSAISSGQVLYGNL